jgi:curved DNA-binding protein CbpA
VERQRQPDLLVLDLERMPSSKHELRRAYRAAAKAAHPDGGGSADAFRAVSEAFERLSRGLDRRAA